MSDGHFQTTLYPSSPYTSGMKAGKAIMRQQAEQAFCQWWRERFGNENENEMKSALKRFIEFLNSNAASNI